MDLEKNLTENDVEEIVLDIITKFKSLQQTFFKGDSSLVKDIWISYKERKRNNDKKEIQFGLIKGKKKLTSHQKKIKDLKNLKLEVYRLLNLFKKNEKDIKEQKKIIEKILETKKDIIAQKKKLGEYLIQTKQKFSDQENMKRHRGRNIDIVEHVQRRTVQTGTEINPAQIIAARIEYFKEEENKLTSEIDTEVSRLEKLKEKRIYMQMSVVKHVKNLLKYPNLLKEAGIKIQECIKFSLKVKEQIFLSSIGGDYTSEEKEYMIDSAKLDLLYKKENENLKKKYAKIYRTFSLERNVKFFVKNFRRKILKILIFFKNLMLNKESIRFVKIKELNFYIILNH